MISGRWIWRDLEQGDDVLLTPEHIARIRTLAAGWDSAENGAASLLFPCDDAYDEDGSFHQACEIFLNCADPGDWAGTIASPYAAAPYAGMQGVAELADIPDPTVIAALAAGETFAFQAEPAEIALWAAADLRADGINPKRPFGSGHVSRDIAAIIDPQSKLSRKERTAAIRHSESRMVLLMQYFVQHAVLQPGLFEQNAGYGWVPKEGAQADGAEWIDAQEWCRRLSGPFYYQTRDYSESCTCLAHLVWEDRVPGDYADMVRQFRLDDFYTRETHRRYNGDTLAQIMAGLEAFGENGPAGARTELSLHAVRVFNSQARYPQALGLLDGMGVKPPHFDPASQPIGGVESLQFLEWLIATAGSGAISDTEFRAILFGERSSPYFPANPWNPIWKLVYEWDSLSPDQHGGYLAHAQAAAVQLVLMRGGYEANS